MRLAVLVLASAVFALNMLACEGVKPSSIGGGNDGGGAANGAQGDGGGGGAGGGGDGGAGAPLPATSFLFVRKVSGSADNLVAVDLATGQERVVTDLRSDGSDGWSIDGFSISPDRTRVVLASLYGPTKADVDTGLSTQRIWTLDMNGGDFTRLTPVFENTGGGQSGFRIDVRDPVFSLDGASVIYDYGEGTTKSGFSRPWVVSTTDGDPPALFPVRNDNCSIIDNASPNPKTGEVLVFHSVCIQSADQGIYLYPAGGGESPVRLVSSDGISLVSNPPRWSADASVFLFTAIDFAKNARSLYAYSMNSKQVGLLVEGSGDKIIMNGSVSPDGNYLVYCVREGDASNLHIVDLTVDPPVDKALTDDGVSCDPVF